MVIDVVFRFLKIAFIREAIKRKKFSLAGNARKETFGIEMAVGF